MPDLRSRDAPHLVQIRQHQQVVFAFYSHHPPVLFSGEITDRTAAAVGALRQEAIPSAAKNNT
jgi:hypothetical protein